METMEIAMPESYDVVRESIHSEIERSILDGVKCRNGIDTSFVGEIVELIADGKVPHVNIKY